MSNRKAFQDTSKWIIFKNQMSGKWIVTPPMKMPKELEMQFGTFEDACAEFAKITSVKVYSV